MTFSTSLKNIGDKRKTNPVQAQLAKEIQLKHRAPVVSINIIDANCASLGDPNGASNSLANESSGPHRVVISSEEQFKVNISLFCSVISRYY